MPTNRRSVNLPGHIAPETHPLHAAYRRTPQSSCRGLALKEIGSARRTTSLSYVTAPITCGALTEAHVEHFAGMRVNAHHQFPCVTRVKYPEQENINAEKHPSRVTATSPRSRKPFMRNKRRPLENKRQIGKTGIRIHILGTRGGGRRDMRNPGNHAEISWRSHRNIDYGDASEFVISWVQVYWRHV